jgi:hypothetical protein
MEESLHPNVKCVYDAPSEKNILTPLKSLNILNLMGNLFIIKKSGLDLEGFLPHSSLK